MGTYEIYVSINNGAWEPYELGPIFNERHAEVVVARLTATSERCGTNRRYEFRRI